MKIKDFGEKNGLAIIILMVLMLSGLLFVDKCHSQIFYVKIDYKSIDMVYYKDTHIPEFQGASCASPDGPDKQTAIIPPDWNWLNTNGYCFSGAPMPAKNITMCFTLTSPGTDIDFNAGFSTIGCAGYSVNYARLYTSAPACVLVDGTALGITTGLTIGANYTWCISLSGTGPPSCQFTSLCPYYQDVTVLPVELLDFYCTEDKEYDILYWTTASEININKFVICGSGDMSQWTVIQEVKALGGNMTTQYNTVVSKFHYFRLYEVDFNSQITTLKTISCDNNYFEKDEFIRVFDMKGSVVYSGLKSLLRWALIANNKTSGIYLILNNKNETQTIQYRNK